VQNISAPLLIAQGANDPRVKKTESDQIYLAMVEKGLEVQYFLYEGMDL
jgi:dipeptidyl aminopeptidase/acylaminoacyl peptidase